MPDTGRAGCCGGGEERRLGAGDRRLLQVYRHGLEAVRHFERIAGPGDRPRPHGEQRVEVGRDGATRRKVTTGLAQLRAPAPREQRPEQQHGPSEPTHQGRVGLVCRHGIASDLEPRGAGTADLGPDAGQ